MWVEKTFKADGFGPPPMSLGPILKSVYFLMSGYAAGELLVGETLNVLHAAEFKGNQREETRREDMQSWTSIPSGSSKVETHPTYEYAADEMYTRLPNPHGIAGSHASSGNGKWLVISLPSVMPPW